MSRPTGSKKPENSNRPKREIRSLVSSYRPSKGPNRSKYERKRPLGSRDTTACSNFFFWPFVSLIVAGVSPLLEAIWLARGPLFAGQTAPSRPNVLAASLPLAVAYCLCSWHTQCEIRGSDTPYNASFEAPFDLPLVISYSDNAGPYTKPRASSVAAIDSGRLFHLAAFSG